MLQVAGLEQLAEVADAHARRRDWDGLRVARAAEDGRRVASSSVEKKKKERLRPSQMDGPPSPKRGRKIGPPTTPPKLCVDEVGDGFAVVVDCEAAAERNAP